MSNLTATLGQLGQASPLYSMLIKMAQQIGGRNKANEIYKNLMPVLNDLLAKGYAFESTEVQAIVAILRDLPAFGAKRANFEKRFLKNEYTLRKLPQDPTALNGSGCWH
ncbi:hypothetical protein BA953_17150 [Vibrio coralliilyticus]|uniref:hypothetical protein n=1 Tax=Vibrio coralliilyticus TaxID=190893 RepID=UPI00081088E1|nr:hypothetical protein [Vibrio coralliilyticus]ANW25917.1 hypothetical protein BA953_17150 [Vibrio coralliilyticus]